MSRKGRIRKEQIEQEEQDRKDYLQSMFNRTVNPKKSNKISDTRSLINGSETSFHNSHPLYHMERYFNSRYNKESLRKILDKTFNLEMMGVSEYCKAIYEVSEYSEFWIRPIEKWKPKTHNRNRQFRSLLRWLFVKYDMPSFMDSVWFEQNSQRHILWYIEIGKGGSAFKVINKDTGLTRKMTHWFMKSPNDFSVTRAIRWSQVLGFGGEEKMAHAVSQCNIITRNCNEFWSSVVHLLSRTHMMDTSQVGPVIDYVGQKRVEDHEYSVKGRTITSILKHTEEWHRQLAKEKRIVGCSWDGMDMPNWNMLEGKKSSEEEEYNKSLGSNQTLYKIEQILTGKSLSKEGKAMHHCVYSYATSCQRGRSSIWSLNKTSYEQGQIVNRRLVTIEVENSTREVVQIRGLCNRKATVKETSIIRKWSQEKELTLRYGW